MTDKIRSIISPELAKALKERDDFLKENPQYAELQEHIETELKKAGNQNNRLSVIAGLMIDSRRDLHKELIKLQKLLIELNDIPKDNK